MSTAPIRYAMVFLALAFTSVAALAGEREIIFNGVQVTEHNISVIEESYDIEFDSGRYWYDRSSGLWGKESGGPEGRIAAGLHIGGPAPESFASKGAAPAPTVESDEIVADEEEGMTSEEVGELIGGVIGLMMLGEMMDNMEQAASQPYYGDDVYYEGGGAYQAGPNSYYDEGGNYEYNSRFGSGSQYSDGSWIQSTNGVGSVGGTSDGCIYTNVGGGWSNC